MGWGLPLRLSCIAVGLGSSRVRLQAEMGCVQHVGFGGGRPRQMSDWMQRRCCFVGASAMQTSVL